MAFTVSLLAQLHDTTQSDDYTTPTFNIPSGDTLLVALVFGRGTLTTDPTVDDNGPGLTWSLPGTDPSAVGNRYIGHFVAKSTASATGVALSVHFLTADTPNGCSIHVVAVTGAGLSGTAAAAIVQNYAAEWASATSHEASFASATDPDNLIITGSMISSEQTITASTGFTEITQGQHPTPSNTAQSQYKTGHSAAFVQGPSWVTGSNGGFTMMEIAAAAASGGTEVPVVLLGGL